MALTKGVSESAGRNARIGLRFDLYDVPAICFLAAVQEEDLGTKLLIIILPTTAEARNIKTPRRKIIQLQILSTFLTPPFFSPSEKHHQCLFASSASLL